MTAPTLNGLRVIAVRMFMLWKGAWVADCELDPDVVATVPTSGPAQLVVGGTSCTGTIDPRASGTFGGKAQARVVGGAGGWDQVVARQDFFADTGVSSTIVYQSTAALIQETVADLVPTVFAPHFERMAGPASRVFGVNDWWVDVTGITNVGPRSPAVADPSLMILDFDGGQQRVNFSCDALLIPNTTLTDSRFNGASPIVRDVEQVFDAHGSHGTAWCSSKPVSRLFGALSSLVTEVAGKDFLRGYRYRLSLYQGNRMALQAVNPTGEVPDVIPLAPWSGVAGATPTLAPSQEVLVTFDFTTPGSPQPINIAYSLDGLPVSVTYDASASVSLGPSAPAVKLAQGTSPLVLAGPYEAMLTELGTFASAVGSATTPAQIIAAGSALATALGALPSPATVNVAAS